MSKDGCANRSVEVWRAKPGDYYADAVLANPDDGITISAGGRCVTKTAREWVWMAWPDGFSAPLKTRSELLVSTAAALEEMGHVAEAGELVAMARRLDRESPGQ